MKERGKALEAYNRNDMDYYSTTSDMPCRKHPSSSSVGICAYCLKDRLVKLVCSDCGEQRLSSCSCSEISSNRNSCTVEVGSVGRVSFLIENERNDASFPNNPPHNKSHHSKTQMGKTEEGLVLRRSSSSCAEIKRGGFWRFGKFFKKKKEKDTGNKSVCGFDDKSDLWLVDHHMGVSRSRSLCSFRGGGGGGGGGWFGSEDGGDLMVSGARSSISGARSSSVTACMVLDSGRRSGFSEAEPRKSGFDNENLVSDFGMRRIGLVEVDNNGGNGGFNGVNRRVFSLKESDFNGMDESGFIDLKLDYSAESNSKTTSTIDQQFSSSSVKMGVVSDSESAFGSMRRGSEYGVGEYGDPFGSSGAMGDGIFGRGGSCRITVNDRGLLKKGRKSLKGWRWIFRHQGKKDEDLMFKT
ncbi:micronuclear linker histone polyprotein-like protein [Trema orientale]|uniref:Micronuclear linker histone polyprotein-like protein n=1 Tax=Trema orientale TaxID=63057 RepID=A0A2P5BFX5_TREOI|nr:micronuclear linker histone polyprotein-like protein [Trema orientale]